ncbi:MAG TPA: MFS transporter [Phycisphaerae bacterium]|nr:MFS transporter [Phycisphaerae bacterium]
MSQAAITPDYQTPILQTYPSLFKNRNFLLLWLAYVISALGDRIHFVIMLALLASLKHKAEAGTQDTAQLNVMMLLPFLLLGPITGVIADRLPRRAIMVTADFIRVAIVLIARTLFLAVPAGLHNTVPGLGGVTYAVLMLLCSELLLGVFSALFSPARNALMPNLVHPDQLLRANSMTNSAGTIASLLGFVLGAFLIKYFWVAAMYVDAATFFCSGVLLVLMSGKALRRQASSAPAADMGSAKSRSILRDFGDALRYLRAHKRAVQVILLMFLFWCCGAIILSGLTGVVTGKFGKTTAEFSTFLGLVGVGMMAGAASCSLARRGIPKEFGIAWAMTMVGVFFFLFSIPQNYALAVMLLMVAAFFGAIMLVSLDTLLQRIVPDYMRGRVMAFRDQLANVGLVGVAIPLAISSAIDHYIVLILRIVAVVVFLVGVLLIGYYYKRQPLPLAIAIARRVVIFYLGIFKRFSTGNAGRIPLKGPVIFVSNHTTAFDPLCLQAASRHRPIQFMMAKEYYEKKPLNYFFKWLKVIPVNRTGNDTASIRTAIRALNEGSCIGMFPEGGISDDGRMGEGKQGVALLALMSNATVVPAYIVGTNTYSGMVSDFLKRSRVTLYFGRPLRFDDLGGKRDEASREIAAGRIMDAIRGLRDRYETNPERRLSSKQWNERHGTPPAAAAAAAAPAA